MSLLTVKDIPVKGKKVLVRADLNVPLHNGKVADDTRIRSSLPTIRYLIEQKARVILISHLGRPKGQVDEGLRLDPVARKLAELLDGNVIKINSITGGETEEAVSRLEEGEVLILENVRFEPGEERNDRELAQEFARLADLYVNDAFGTAHRAHASTEGVARFLPAVAGLLLEKEVEALQKCLDQPERPFTAVLGGAKVSDKIGVIQKFAEITDYLLIGGGMANTFLIAHGYDMASSFYEESRIEIAKDLLSSGQQSPKNFFLPDDLVVVKELKEGAPQRVVSIGEVPRGWQAVDIGPQSAEAFSGIIKKSRLVIWNGPLGVFEVSPFHRGTETVARAAVESDAFVLIGGGDTAAAFEKIGLIDGVDHVSTGGGATLEFLEGKELPGISVLKRQNTT